MSYATSKSVKMKKDQNPRNDEAYLYTYYSVQKKIEHLFMRTLNLLVNKEFVLCWTERG